jgi:CheY-like chemotaxis protein
MPKTLLLADDSVTIQKVVGISFANEDVRLITVDNGDAAIARARQERPDVILADVVMPGKSGYEVCEAVKADPNLRHIPVLLLTGTFEAFDEARATRAGAAGHIAKPFESQLLVEQVKRLLAQSDAPRSAPARAPAAATPPPARAAAPAAAPAARAAAPPPVPPVAPAAADDSFEFFSDELAEPAAGASPETADTFALDENDSAFAFGDAEISELEPEPPKPAARPRAAAPAAGERTVAILPEQIPVTGREIPVDHFEDIAVGGDDAADDAEFAPLDPPTSAGNDAFEFEFDTAPPASGRDGSLRVDSDDLAQATVLDPNGASGFDVGNADLEEPIVAPVRAPAPPPAPARPAQRPLAPRPPAAERFEPVVSPEDSFSGMSADAADEAELAPFAADELDESSLEVLEPQRPAAAPRAGASAPAAARRSGASAPPPAQAAAPSSAQSVLDAIAPQLRAQIHDTLEKIAWESFSAVTEQIVRQALERVETVAWEVIPQMAETLVREEIRRMKGE